MNYLLDEKTVIAQAEAESKALMTKISALMGDRAMELCKVARQIADETTQMRAAGAREQRELFLNAAKTVLDGLQSLSLDLTRVLDRDVPEKLWKGLSRADVPGFARRLASMRDDIPAAQLRAKFASDSLFRTHTQAYLRQFEELMDQANRIDQGEILASTLMSSDVGKIYYFLSGAVGRERTMLKTA